MEQDWVATSLGPNTDALAVHAVGSDEPWETIPLFHAQYNPRLILGIFPSYLQIDVRFYRAVRALKLPSLCVAQEQMRAGLALINPLSVGGIVTTLSALKDVLEQLPLLAPGAEPYIQVVLAKGEEPPNVSYKKIFYEVHVTPGLPVRYQYPEKDGIIWRQCKN